MSRLFTITAGNKHFDGVTALANFSAYVNEGEIVGLLGPNGAGKTTLFNVIGGLVAPDSGSVEFNGRVLIGYPVHQVANSGVALTFQNVSLIERITVLENILLCFKKQPGEKLFNVFFRPGLCKQHEAANHRKALILLGMAGLSEKADDMAHNLSYSQQKLLSLLCCLASDAKLLLLDEPVAGLAPEMAERILAIIATLPSQGKSAVVIEHDIDALKKIANRMIFMDAGRIVCEGTPNEVLNDPRVIDAYLD